MDVIVDAKKAETLSDSGLVRTWRDLSEDLNQAVREDQVRSTGADVARDLGSVEREMERRGMRHDNPHGDVRGPDGVTHKA